MRLGKREVEVGEEEGEGAEAKSRGEGIPGAETSHVNG